MSIMDECVRSYTVTSMYVWKVTFFSYAKWLKKTISVLSTYVTVCVYVCFIHKKWMYAGKDAFIFVCLYVCMYVRNLFLCEPRRHCYSVCEVEEYNPCQLGEVIANPWHRSVQTTETIKCPSLCYTYLKMEMNIASTYPLHRTNSHIKTTISRQKTARENICTPTVSFNLPRPSGKNIAVAIKYLL